MTSAARLRLAPPARPGERSRRRARWLRGLALAGALGVGASAAAEPLLHEYIELGPGQGPVEPAVTGTRAAVPQPPSDGSEGDGTEGVAGAEGASGAGEPSAEDPFSIDRDTTRPERVSYADPFTPTVVPFKRSIVYDSVNRQGDLVVRDPSLVDVPTLTAARANDEHFHASFELELRAGERAPIPSVAPGARLVLVHREPRVPLRIGADSAENWYVTASVSRSVLLTLQVVADRRVFGSDFADVSFASLAPALPPLPAEVKRSALDVARALGVDDSQTPRQAVARLVEHFRRFSASERRPQSQGLALYRELALTARGICRHRSYAFMITALGLGIPTRAAMNEAHAWVEVFDGDVWHRIDLGGAAAQLDMDDEGRPRHVEPRDPFSWPDRRESGLAMAERRVTVDDPASEQPAPEGPASPNDAPTASDPPNTEPNTPPPAAGQPLDPELAPGDAPPEAVPQDTDVPEADVPPAAPAPTRPEPAGSVALHVGVARAERGKGLFVSGRVESGGRPCSGARVDVTLGQARGESLPLGSLISDGRGEFRGHLVIPWSAALGEHTLIATASGCSPRPAAR